MAPVSKAPHALAESKRDHQKVSAGCADREQAEECRENAADRHADRDHQPEIPLQSKSVIIGENSGEIGADPEIGGLAQRREAGAAKENVEAMSQNGVHN